MNEAIRARHPIAMTLNSTVCQSSCGKNSDQIAAQSTGNTKMVLRINCHFIEGRSIPPFYPRSKRPRNRRGAKPAYPSNSLNVQSRGAMPAARAGVIRIVSGGQQKQLFAGRCRPLQWPYEVQPAGQIATPAKTTRSSGVAPVCRTHANLAADGAVCLCVRNWDKANSLAPIDVGGDDHCRPCDLASMGSVEASMESAVNRSRTTTAEASVRQSTGASIVGQAAAGSFGTGPKSA